MQRKIGLLIAAAAAYGAYRYSRLSSEQKSSLKQKGKDFLNKNLGDVNGMFTKAKEATGHNGF